MLKVGGGAAVKEQCVADRTEPDMREKQKHSSRSAGFVDRRVIVHRAADRGALRLCTLCLFSARCAEALVAVNPSALGFIGGGFTAAPDGISLPSSLSLSCLSPLCATVSALEQK